MTKLHSKITMMRQSNEIKTVIQSIISDYIQNTVSKRTTYHIYLHSNGESYISVTTIYGSWRPLMVINDGYQGATM